MGQVAFPQGTDILVNGNVYCNQVTPLQPCIGNAAITAPATPAQAIDTPKLRHRSVRAGHFNADGATTAAVVRKVAHVVYGAAGAVVAFHVGAVAAAAGAATVTIRLLKNGTNILSATFTLDNTTAAFALAAAPGFTTTTLAAGDVLEAQITAAAAGGGTLPAGVFYRLLVDEDPA